MAVNYRTAGKFAGLPWPDLTGGSWQVQMAGHRLQREAGPYLWCLCCEGFRKVIPRLGLQGHWRTMHVVGAGLWRCTPLALCPY